MQRKCTYILGEHINVLKKAYFNILYGQAYKYEITKEHKFPGICHQIKPRKIRVFSGKELN